MFVNIEINSAQETAFTVPRDPEGSFVKVHPKCQQMRQFQYSQIVQSLNHEQKHVFQVIMYENLTNSVL